MTSTFLNKFKNIQKGFTLVELLIVIAILGILATAVLVAIDPIEQINRGKDSGRINSTGQLGHAILAYYTSQQLTSYPAVSTSWQTTYLLGAGEIKSVVKVPAATAGNCLAANMETGSNMCYIQLGAGTDAAVWTILESKANRTKAGACPAAQTVAAVWIASLGKAGLDCFGVGQTTPTATDTLY